MNANNAMTIRTNFVRNKVNQSKQQALYIRIDHTIP